MKHEAKIFDLDTDIKIPSNYPMSALLGVVLTSSVCAVQAGDLSASSLLQQTSDNMLDALKQHQVELKQNPKSIIDIVNNNLAPHVDMYTASRGALGKYWRKANHDQRLQFENEFRNLLINFYSLALVEYTSIHEIPDDTIEFLQTDDTNTGNKTAVHTRVKQNYGRPVKVIYYLHEVNKNWMVYDVSVEGISIISAYRSVFASELRSKGVDALIKTLAEHNKKLLDS